MNLNQFKKLHNQLEGKRDHLKDQLAQTSDDLEFWERRYNKSLRVRLIFQKASQLCQQRLEERFSKIVLSRTKQSI